jgi:hypothetical protein
MRDESHIRAIFRSTSPLRKPAAILGMLLLVVIFPALAMWELREDFLQQIRDLAKVLKS